MLRLLTKSILLNCSLVLLMCLGSACSPDNAVSMGTVCTSIGVCTKPKIEAVLTFVPAALRLQPNQCGSLHLRVSPREAVGKNAVTLNLTTSSASGAFFTDEACTRLTTTVITPGQQMNSAVFFYKDSSPGTHTLKGAAPRGAVATLTATIQ